MCVCLHTKGKPVVDSSGSRTKQGASRKQSRQEGEGKKKGEEGERKIETLFTKLQCIELTWILIQANCWKIKR